MWTASPTFSRKWLKVGLLASSLYGMAAWPIIRLEDIERKRGLRSFPKRTYLELVHSGL